MVRKSATKKRAPPPQGFDSTLTRKSCHLGRSFNYSHRSVFDVGQNLQDFWCQRDRICKTIAAGSQYDNLESVAREIKLKRHVAVHCDEHLKASFFGFL